jgi:putative DNA primase/helicase
MSARDALTTVHDALSTAGCDPRWRGERLESRCPSHDDRSPSLSVGRGTKQPVVFHCHAGCHPETITKALDLSWAELCEPRSNGHGRLGEALAEYHYTDEGGRQLFRVVRYPDKQFRQHAADGAGGWRPKLGDARRVLYRLPDVAAAIEGGEEVWLVEGEKDADRLRTEGVVATCNPMGAGSWRPDYTATLAGAAVNLVADRDPEGYRHAHQVAAVLGAAGATVTVLEPATGKDISDHLAAGLALDDLAVVDLATIIVDPPPAPGHASGNGRASSNGAGHRDRVLLAAGVTRARVEWLWPGRLPVGKLVMLDGDPDQGKSTLSLDFAARLSAGRPMPDGHELEGAAPTLVLSAEDGLADTIVPRLAAAGADLDQVHIWTEVGDTDPDGDPRYRPPVIPGDLDRLAHHVRSIGARLVIVDVLMAYLDGAVNSHHDQDIRRVLHALSVIAERTKATILILRHLNKSGGGKALYRGGGSIGIIGAARSGLLAAKHPEDPNRKVLAVHKHNLAEPAPALLYEIVSSQLHHCGAIRWLGPTAIDADALMEMPRNDDGEDGALPRRQAIEFLRDLLTGRSMSVQDVKKEAIGAGLSWATVRRAQSQLGIKPEHHGRPTDSEQWWEWSLPAPKVLTDPQDAHRPGVEHLGESEHLGDDTDRDGRLDI